MVDQQYCSQILSQDGGGGEDGPPGGVTRLEMHAMPALICYL